VCGTAGVLDEAWSARTSAEIERLRHEARDADQAANDLVRAVRDARSLLAQVPALPPAAAVGVETATLGAALIRWAEAPGEAADLVRHLEDVGPEVVEAIGHARDAATKELQRRQDAWQPVAAQLAAWLPDGRAAQEMRAASDDLKEAASWLAGETTRVRNDRFAPIADQVKSLWNRLRFTSNVSLDAVNLEGARARRRVELSVSVDDTPGAALSVMSQGELHCLALSLFLPRAMLPGSPFRFLVIDDPVQAMDANRVDGLASVLAHTARTHQVIVFTHDERLPAAARRLGIAARVFEVTRGERSMVTVRPRGSPVDDYLDDARALLATTDYPEAARRRVVPGLCRNALEAACVDTTRRRLLLQGRLHAQVDDELEQAGKLLPRLALALFGDADRAGDVLADVNRRWGRTAGDCVQALQRGSHRFVDDEPQLLVNETTRIAHGILNLT
jgi:ABC-type lipoprotein export system ATPase subunit